MKTAFLTLYFGLLVVISIYGIHLFWLISLHLKSRNERAPYNPLSGAAGEVPRVTVQLPIYNEKRVAVRLIEAVTAFDWPADRLEIQVLDDSDDSTTDLVSQHLEKRDKYTPAIHHLRRSNRIGFKAGALANGLKRASGEFVAIFDADNLPRPDFLERMIGFFDDPEVGMVQARWSFLNRAESFLCRAQGLFLDAHFRVEQQARYAGGLLFNFNGTAGVWRRTAIEEAGGWQHDTLTEDLDLSMRAQLDGWKFIYEDGYDVPTELPNSITAFKSQQYRWSKGAVQAACKLLPRILTSALPVKARIASFFHLTHKVLSVALLALALLLIPALYFRMEGGVTKLFFIDLPIFLAGTGSMSLFYSLANRSEERSWSWRQAAVMPFLTSLGVALAVNNTKAIFSAIFGRTSLFVRTPKSGSTDAATMIVPRSYACRPDTTLLAESILSGYALVAVIVALALGLYPTLPFLLTFLFGFGYFSFKGISDLRDCSI